MVLKLTRTDIAFVKGQKKMMDSFKKKIEKEVDKITLANTAIADWNEKIESIDKFTVGLYGKTVTEIMGIIEVEEQPPLIVQDKATGEYVPNPEAVGEEEEEKEEETPEVEEEQIPDSVPDKQENIESELKMDEKEDEKEIDTPEDDNVPFEEELGWPDEDSDESPAEKEEKEEEVKDPMEDSEWPDPDYPDDWNN